MFEDSRNSREYFRVVKAAARDLKHIEQTIEQLKSQKLTPTIDGMPHAKGANGAPSARIDSALDYEELMQPRIKNDKKRVGEALDVICGVNMALGYDYGDILTHLYINCLQWKEVEALEGVGTSTISRKLNIAMDYMDSVGYKKACLGEHL